LLEKRRAVTKQTSSGGWGEREESFTNVLLLKYWSIVRWESILLKTGKSAWRKNERRNVSP
jgi:hypothetical protein